MTIDKSLRVKRGATRNRSVMTRVERIQRLREADRWKEGDSPLGLPKVRVRKLTMKKKKKKKEDEEGATAEGGAAATPAAAAKPAGGAKPAAGAKAAGGSKPAGGKK
jgi:small basic protein (TIGR04137 family)